MSAVESKIDLVKEGHLYQHYKGPQYKVYKVVRHSETLEEFVYYECLYPNDLNQFWVRPIQNFLSFVEVDGQQVPRFKPL